MSVPVLTWQPHLTDHRGAVPNYEARVLACKDHRQIPPWLGFGQYLLASCLCLSVPYRVKFAELCYDIPKYQYVKRFYAPVRRNPTKRLRGAAAALTSRRWFCGPPRRGAPPSPPQ